MDKSHKISVNTMQKMAFNIQFKFNEVLLNVQFHHRPVYTTPRSEVYLKYNPK